MVNLCTFIGNLGKDPTVRAIPSGAKVAEFSIACTERWRDKDSGDMKEKTEWVSITCWRGLAETVEKYCKKGMRVYVAGKFNTQKWEKDGVTHYKSFILADTVTFLSSAKDVAGSGGARPSQGGSNHPGPEDDLPF